MKPDTLKKTMLVSVCMALCVVLPGMLSVIPGAERAYGTLHMPVLLCALACGWKWGLFTALGGVTVSAVISGVPTVAALPSLLAECAVSAVAAGLFARRLREKADTSTAAGAVLVSMLLGRAAGGAVSALMFAPTGTAFLLWLGAYMLAAMPGGIIQLVLLPVIFRALLESGLVPREAGNPDNPGEERPLPQPAAEPPSSEDAPAAEPSAPKNGEEENISLNQSDTVIE